MRLGLGLGLSSRGNPQVSGGAPNVPPGDIIDDGGFSEPPIVVTVGATIQFKGKKASGASGKFIYNIGVAEAGVTYTMRYDPDWSGLANQGLTALVGFGLKQGNDFHLAGLKGDGAGGLLAYEVYGANKWNHTAGFTTVNGGATANGTKDGPNWVRFEVSLDGSTYTISTSADGESWDEEISDAVPSPFSNAIGPPVFGIAVFLEAADAGSFIVGIELWQTSATEEGGDLWTPAELGSPLRFWVRGDDLAGVDGSAVSTWEDQSGNNNDATAAGGSEPQLETAELNSMNVVRAVRANSDVMTVGNGANLGGGTTSASVYMLVKIISNAAVNGSPIAWAGQGSTADHYSYSDGQLYLAPGSSTRYTVGDPGDLTAWHLAGIDTTNSNWIYYFNGTQFFANGSNTYAGPAGGQPTLFLAFNQHWDGYMAECIITNSVLSQSDREKVEGYLAHKWGVASVLDSGHPYKNDPPTI